MKASERLEAILADANGALNSLHGVLKFIQAGKLVADLRVLMINSVIVTLVSTMEEAFRQLFIEYLTVVEERIDSHKKLRGPLRNANAEKYVDEIRKAVKEKKEADALRLLNNLRICFMGDAGFRLAKESITHNKGNFRSSQLAEIAGLIGLADLWKKMADHDDISDYTGLTYLEQKSHQLIADWNAIYDERDLIVHRISQANGWAADRVGLTINLSVIILTRCTACLVSDLLTLVPDDDAAL